MDFKGEIIEVYCNKFTQSNNLVNLKNKIKEAVVNNKCFILYYATLGDNKENPQPFSRITDFVDRANLTYLSYIFSEKNKDGQNVVVCDNYPNNDISSDFCLELGNKLLANVVYMFNIFPVFKFDSD